MRWDFVLVRHNNTGSSDLIGAHSISTVIRHTCLLLVIAPMIAGPLQRHKQCEQCDILQEILVLYACSRQQHRCFELAVSSSDMGLIALVLASGTHVC